MTFLVLGVSGCSNLPRDPEHTLENVRKQHRLRVGLSEHPPWVVRTSGEPAGAEVDAIRTLASELGAKPEWRWGTENQLMRAAKEFELDVVLCGLDADTPWSKEVGLTRPYVGKQVIAVPPGENGWIVHLEDFLARHRSQLEAFRK